MQEKISVMVVDDHAVVRHAVKTIIQTDPHLDLVGESIGDDGTLKLIEELKPNLLVLDLALPGRTGYELMAQLKELHLPIKVVILTMFEEEHRVKNAFAAGANAYLLKDSSPREIIEALHVAAKGDTFLPERFRHLRGELKQGKSSCTAFDPLYKLSKREREVFFLIVEGMPNRTIAKRLFVSPRTIETHRARLIKKLGVNSTADLIRYAIRNDLVSL